MADNLADLDPRHGAAEPAGNGPENPVNGAPAPAAAADAPADPLMALLQRLDQRAARAELVAQQQHDQYSELRGLLNAQAAELAALRGGAPPPTTPGHPPAPPGYAPPAADMDASTLPSATPVPPPRVRLFAADPPAPSPVPRAFPGALELSRDADDDDSISVASSTTRRAPTSKNYQNFLRAAEKQTPFTGADKDDVNEWLTSVEEMADIHGVNMDEALQGVKTLLGKSARRFYREHLAQVEARAEPWHWLAAKSWFLRKFNPESRILRKVTEYHKCAQGRRSVNEYLDELLELRAYTSTALAPTWSSACGSLLACDLTFNWKFASTWRLPPRPTSTRPWS